MNYHSIKYIRECIEADFDKGVLVWKKHRPESHFSCPRGSNVWHSRFAGTIAGTICSTTGYNQVNLSGIIYRSHRLIYALHYDEWPEYQVDHINGDRADNCIGNLRAATCAENQQNKSMQSNNTTGVTGVNWFKPTLCWEARITKNRKTVRLGYFNSLLDAVAARLSAEKEYGFPARHGR